MCIPMSQLLVILMFGYVVEPLLTKVYIENAIRCREGGKGEGSRLFRLGEEGERDQVLVEGHDGQWARQRRF